MPTAANTTTTGGAASKATARRFARTPEPAPHGPAPLDPGAARLAALQRSLGNRGFRDLLRGAREAPATEASREAAADRLAERVMATPAVTAASSGPAGGAPGAAQAPWSPLFSSGGEPLPRAVRGFYEPRFGQDLGDVRVHTGPLAERHARALGARAFTDGNHIWMGRNQSVEPSLLLAHELAHVVEGRGAARPVLARKEDPDDPDAKVSLGPLDNALFTAAAEQAVGSTQWTVMRELLRGVAGGLQSAPPAQVARIQAKFASIGFREGLDYAEGYGLGLLEGLWLGLKGLGEAVFTLVKLPYELNRFLYEKFPLLAVKYGARLVQFVTEGDGISARLQAAIWDMMTHPLETARALSGLIETIHGMALAKLHELGHGVADKILALIEEPWFAYGRDLGKIVGQVLFEVILAVASEGIANAVKQGLSLAARLGARVVEGAVEILRGLRVMVGNFIEWIGKLVGRLAGKVGELLAELKSLMSRLGTLLEELIGEPQLLGDTGTGVHVPVPGPKGPTIMEARAVKPPGGGTGPKVADLTPPKVHPSKAATEAAETAEAAGRSKLKIPEAEGKLPPELLARRRKILESLEQFVKDDEAFKALKKFDPQAKVGVQGSVVRGTVGNPRKVTFGQAFDPEMFDLDLFVVSEKVPQTGKVFPLPGARERLFKRFEEVMEGLKFGGKGLSVKVFRPGEALPTPFLMLE
jgi:hypothetical protein